MANDKKLDCVILGLLSHEDMTGYAIKKRMDTTLSFFWGASFGSIYPTLKGLVESGLAVKRNVVESNRNKITYAITEQGRIHLRAWLALPVQKDEIRYETLLKLFFADETDEKTTIAHIRSFEAKIRKELPFLRGAVQELEGIVEGNRAHFYYLLTAKFGVKAYEAYLEWCEEAKRLLGEKE